MRRFYLHVLTFIILTACIGVTASMAQAQNRQLVPICGPDCNFGHLIELVENFIYFAIILALPIGASMFAYAGALYLTSGGNPEHVKKAHKVFWGVFVGIVFILAAWLIIHYISIALLAQPRNTSLVN